MSDPNSRQAQIGANIRRLRKRAGLRQEDIAGPLGLSVSQLSRIESAENRCYADVVLGIAELLSVDIRELFLDAERAEDACIAQRAIMLGGRDGGLALIKIGTRMLETS